MDNLKNQKLLKSKVKPFTLKKQIISRLVKLLVDYLNARTPESRDKNFEIFKDEFLKQKKAHPLFDVNQPIGAPFSFGELVCEYYFDIALRLDDLRLFKLLLECGLKDANIEGVLILHMLITGRALKCLKEFLSVGDFSRHFVNGKYNPLTLAVMNFAVPITQDIEVLQSIEMLQIMVEHPDFKIEYLNYEQEGVYLNPLLMAITNYHYKAVQYMLERGVPCASTTLPTTGFDLLITVFLNYYSSGHASVLLTGRKNNKERLRKEMMTLQNIIQLFNLLLNRTPQSSNIFQLIQANYNGSKKIDIFSYLNELLEKNLNIKDGPLMFLLNILASTGAGLFFHEWPQKIKGKYKNVPFSAEIMMPIMSLSGQVTKVCYYFSDFEAYLEDHHASFEVLEGLNQYLQNKILMIKPEHSNYIKAKQLAEKVGSYLSFALPPIELKPVPIGTIDDPSYSLLGLLSKLIAETQDIIVDKDNLSYMLSQQKDGCENIVVKILNEKSLLSLESDPKAIHSALEFYFRCLPQIYKHLINLNQIYRQLFSIQVYARDLSFLKNSIEKFNTIRNRIDFYSMQWLYYVLHVQKIEPKEIIELVQALSTILNLVYKKTRVNDRELFHPSYYRMQYILQALLVGAYSKTNNISQAKKAFKKALLILEAANNPNIFTKAYVTMVHHFVVTNGFSNMMNFGITHMPKIMHAHLCQIIQHEEGICLSRNAINNLMVHLKNEIKNKHFIQVKELLNLLSKNMPKEKTGMLVEIIQLVELQYAEFLTSLKSTINRENLLSQIHLDISGACMVINFQHTCLKTKKISSMLPFNNEIDNQIFTISFPQIFQDEDKEALFLSIKKINDLDVLQKQEMQALEAKMANLAVATAHESVCLCYTPYHSHSNDEARKQKIEKPIKTIKSCSQNEPSPKVTPQENNLTVKKINIIEVKKLVGLGNDYSDLIMIHSSYSKNNKKFIAIKKEPEFLGFLKASCLFKNEHGEWGINSVNPYGKNQHGVKYDKKLIGTKEVIHLAKLKASSSDRAIGYGKEINYEGSKIIVYVIDTILPHRKADKVFKL